MGVIIYACHLQGQIEDRQYTYVHAMGQEVFLSLQAPGMQIWAALATGAPLSVSFSTYTLPTGAPTLLHAQYQLD